MFYFIFNLNFLCVLLRMFQWLLVGFPGSAVENLPAMQETRVQSLGWGDPLEKELATHSIFWPGKPRAQRSLVGCPSARSPWSRFPAPALPTLLWTKPAPSVGTLLPSAGQSWW